MALAVACGSAMTLRAPAQSPQSPPQNSAPPSDAQKPQGQQQANPFPDDSNAVPVLPSNNAAPPPADDSYGGALSSMPGADSDPVKSPDDASPSAEGSDASSSSAGLDNLLKPPPDEDKGKHRKHDETEPTHTESAKEDESVGSYYLDQKNWRAALSRFESALVLDPENPDVYWGLAEAQRHLGEYGGAKANYLKVMEYDPDSRHSKDAQKYLKDPDLARAKALSTASDAPQQ